jgi:hypothetical protein
MPNPRPFREDWPHEPWRDPDWSHQQEAWRGSDALIDHDNASEPADAESTQATTNALRETLQTLAQAASLQVRQVLELRSAFDAELKQLRLQIESLEGRQASSAVTAKRPDWLEEVRAELDGILNGTDAAELAHASQLSCDAVEHTVRLLAKLSSDIQRPEIGVDVQGNVTLDWQVVADKVFTIAVSANCMIFWAGLFGENRCHGAERFGDSLPMDLERGIRRALAG